MLDLELLDQLIPLLNRAGAPHAAPGMDRVTDTERAAARAAIEAILSAHGMTLGMFEAELDAIGAPALERARSLPRLASPLEIRPGSEWLPLPFPDGTVAYATLFPADVVGHAVPVVRDGRQVWLGCSIAVSCATRVLNAAMIVSWKRERLAQLMAQEHPNPNPKGGATILPFPRRSHDG